MQIDFEYTLDDLRELRAVWNNNSNIKALRPGRGLLGWALFLGLATLVIWLLNTHPSPSPATSPVSQGFSFEPWVPLMLMGAYIIHIFYRIRFPSVKTLKADPAFGRSISLTIDDFGISSDDGPIQSRFQWTAFDLVVETDTGLFVRVRTSRGFVMIPKRALSTAEALEQVRQKLANVVEGPSGAFPVLPIVTSLPVKESPA